jgi:hypothetical protein
MTDTFPRCGHDRTPENTRISAHRRKSGNGHVVCTSCRLCESARSAAAYKRRRAKDIAGRGLCKHCERRLAHRRGLCYCCEQSPAIRALYNAKKERLWHSPGCANPEPSLMDFAESQE